MSGLSDLDPDQGYFSTTTAAPISDVGWNVIVQPLNHSNEADGHFHQSYWYNKQFYNGDGPVILETAGEWDANTDPHPTFCDYYARYLNGLCLRLEHRYYGESPPDDIHQSDSYAPGTFRFLSTDQAIEDVGRFIKLMKDPALEFHHGLVISPNSKWIVYGCSYGGTLAAWSKQRFPDLIFAAVLSSAPLEAQMDYSDEFQGLKLRFHQGATRDAWFYQQCTEFGFFNFGPEKAWYPGYEEWFVNLRCSRFNEGITAASVKQAIHDTNQKHHGKDYFEERVIIVHGDDDHWKHSGISKPDHLKQELMPVIIIPHAKHCEDGQYPPRPRRIEGNLNWEYPPDTDFEQLKIDIAAAQNQIIQILSGWLQRS